MFPIFLAPLSFVSVTLQVRSETLDLRSMVAKNQDFGPLPLKIRANGILCPLDSSDPAFDVRMFVSTGPTCVFSFHGGRETVQLG